MLYIVPTPIGNLKDITLRALDILQSVDAVIVEDTRRTALLLNHYNIKKPFIILNDFNETKTIQLIINRLKNGENFALVSDAGTPLIADPGYKLIRDSIKESIPVDSLPGPSSVITALTLSALPPDKFIFLGFLPEKEGKRKEILEKTRKMSTIMDTTFIAFVSPYKLVKTLEDIRSVLGDISIVLAKELTKVHQSVQSQKISDWILQFKKQSPKGEWIFLYNLKDQAGV